MRPKAHSTTRAERTRHRILLLLKKEGPSDSISLAQRLHLSAMAVRQHLYALQSENLVKYTKEARPIGRPVKLWQLMLSADRFFPDGHSELAIDLMDAIRRSIGEQGLRRVLKSRVSRQEQSLHERTPSGASLEDRLAALAEQQTRDGYLAEIHVGEDGTYLLIENHCPIRAAVATCATLCDAELQFFKSALGKRTQAERVEHIQDGSRRCVYRISSC
jgi:predicted ArsR family transcriptional regulator